MDVLFRPAAMEDYQEIRAMFQSAVHFMQSENIDQWDAVYPDDATLLNDIKNRQMYLLTQNNAIVCAVVLNEEQDAQYSTGDWSCKDIKIAVIHRLCVHPDFQNMGVGRDTMLRAERLLAQRGYAAIRLDTFAHNPKAIHLYARLGYRQAGTVRFRKGDFLLFEKLLQPSD